MVGFILCLFVDWPTIGWEGRGKGEGGGGLISVSLRYC